MPSLVVGEPLPVASQNEGTQAADSPRTVMDEGIVLQHSQAPRRCQAAVSCKGHRPRPPHPLGSKSHLYPIDTNEIYSN